MFLYSPIIIQRKEYRLILDLNTTQIIAHYTTATRRGHAMLKNTETTYGSVARGFHWLLFLMLSFSIVAGNFLASMPKGAEKLQAATMHKSFGLVLLVLILLRLAWRLANVTPKDPQDTSALQNLLAHAMHWALYILMFAQPLSGILMSQAAGHPVNFFGLLDMPVVLDKDQALAEFFRGAHGTVWILLVLAVTGHAAAALYHRFVLKDGVLQRMSVGVKA
jgi:cytochrome b561